MSSHNIQNDLKEQGFDVDAVTALSTRQRFKVHGYDGDLSDIDAAIGGWGLIYPDEQS